VLVQMTLGVERVLLIHIQALRGEWVGNVGPPDDTGSSVGGTGRDATSIWSRWRRRRWWRKSGWEGDSSNSSGDRGQGGPGFVVIAVPSN